MGIMGALALVGFTMIFLWVIIYFVAGINNHSWTEIFIWSLFFVLIGTANRFMQIFSTNPGFIVSVTIVSALLVGVLLYVLLDYRIGIGDKKKRLTIAGIFVGMKLAFQLLF